MGRLPEAINVYDQGLQRYQNSIELLYNFAVARWQEGQLDIVKTLVNKIIALNPRHEGALALAARLK